MKMFQYATRSGALLSIVCVAVCLPACSGSNSSQNGGKDALVDDVYVTNYPTLYFAERIGGEHCEFVFPFPAGEDPAYVNPETSIIRDMQQARLILTNGANYEKWANQVSLPGARTIDTSANFKDQFIYILDGPSHRHGPDGPSHQHAGIALSTWLDPTLATKQAQAICEALSESWPDHRSDFESSLKELESDLESIDQQLSDASPGERPLIASHPVYEYPAKRYGWHLESVHWEPNAEPSESDWEAFDMLRKDHPAAFMIWEDEPLESTRAALESRNIEVIVFHPCGNRPADSSQDYLVVMNENIERLKAAFASSE